MIALKISLLMKGLWLYRIYRFLLGACLSKISVQIVENAPSLFFVYKLSLYIKLMF